MGVQGWRGSRCLLDTFCVCVCACVGGFVISLLPVKKTEEKAQRRGGGWMSDPFIDSSLQRVVILFHRSLLSHSLPI